jgi:hypothetical protein
MMNQYGGRMGGWSGGGMWLVGLLAVVIVALLVVVISKQSKR